MDVSPQAVVDGLIGFGGLLAPDGTILHLNASLHPSGSARDPFPARKAWECSCFSHSAQAAELVSGAVQRAAAGEVVRLNTVIRMGEDALRWADLQLAPLRDASGVVTHLLASGIDITDYKVAVDRLRLALRGARACTWEWHIESGGMTWSGETEYLCGFLPGNAPASQDAWHALVHSEDRDRLKSALHDALHGDAADSRVEFRIVRPDGTVRWLLGIGRVVERGLNGLPVRMAGMYVDITDHKKTDMLLTKRTALLEAYASGAPVGLAFVDTECRYARVNEALARLHGVPAEAHLGHTIEEIIPRLWPAIRPLIRQALSGMTVANAEVSQDAGDGQGPSTRLVSYYPVYFEEHLMGVGIVVVDISAQKRAEELLREADHRKDEFLATLAHELRNPLAPIRNAVEILKFQIHGDPAADAARGIIERQVEQLVRLVDDLLDVSRITRGKLQLRRRRSLLNDAIEKAVETSLPHIQRAAHELTVNLPQQPLHVDMDVIRIAQVVSNLLQNACIYTRPPHGHIWLSAFRQGKEAVIRIRDNGIGMAPEDIPRVFDMFTQLGDGSERTQGLGIGLALARRLVEAHGGTIAAESPGMGRGSTFTVRLPAAIDESSPGKLGATPAEEMRHLSARRMLIVDDNEDNARSLAALLRLHGNRVDVAFGGEEALAKMRLFRPEIVLLDIGMPGMNGYETCRAMREAPGGDAVVIVAMTGWDQEEARRKSGRAGFDGHLVKPLDYAALVALLRPLLTKGAAE